MERYIVALQNYELKSAELEALYPDKENEEQQNKYNEELMNSEEGEAFKMIGFEVESKDFAEIMELGLLASYKGAVDQSEILKSKAIDILKKIDLEKWKILDRKVWNILRNQNTKSFLMSANVDWQQEMKAHSEIASLYGELDALVIKQVQVL